MLGTVFVLKQQPGQHRSDTAASARVGRQGADVGPAGGGMHDAMEEAGPDREPDHARLHRQLRGSFATTYLTLLSIIQGVALADLAVVVGGGYEHLTAAQWLMVAMNFFTIVSVWNHFMADSISMEWIPSFSDAVLPFSFGGVELLLNHALVIGLALWLAGMAAAAALEAIGTWFISRKAGQETSDAQLLRLFTSRVPGYLRHGLGGTALFLLLAMGTHLGHIEATSSPRDASGRLALLALATVFGWGGIATLNAIQYWRDIVAYARTGQLPPAIVGRSAGMHDGAGGT